ncbi:unnamed protein product [Amoebophrya sp. A120]|nr:unnamed protein product [Amoebophrya sp. A120]|eukprot:GSA120T00018550001.1
MTMSGGSFEACTRDKLKLVVETSRKRNLLNDDRCFDILHDMEANEELIAADSGLHIVLRCTKTTTLEHYHKWHPNMLRHGRFVVDDDEEEEEHTPSTSSSSRSASSHTTPCKKAALLEYGDRLVLVNGRATFAPTTNIVPGSRLLFWRASGSENFEDTLPDCSALARGCRCLSSCSSSSSSSAASKHDQQRAALCTALLAYIIHTTSATFAGASRILKKELDRKDAVALLKGLSAYREDIERLALHFAANFREFLEPGAANRAVDAEREDVDEIPAAVLAAKVRDDRTSSPSQGVDQDARMMPSVPTANADQRGDETATEPPSPTAAREIIVEVEDKVEKAKDGQLPAAPVPIATPTPELYRCRQCRTVLFSDQHIAPHEPGHSPCTPCLFVEPVSWMAAVINKGERQGKLTCPKCKAKVGNFNWVGIKCGCGHWRSPAFAIHKDKIDSPELEF